ncbi:PilZ domain-containing protein [Reinekea marinisedimentorum]|uniref:PilZ domain-containing protein n=1 Tax=Reinekea marinisedimentorum TaxID=230495 RepID=A0A4R3IBC7_9GAMM|nr:PilZ domain-containing protein [Reinekea marinisedimentorum]TCS41757.1 PilZ domain-containing protein [Reinekea marinisedimentorum]
MTSTDKRRFQRIPFDAGVSLSLKDHPDQIFAGTLQDISLKGALFKLNEKDTLPTVGQAGELTIRPIEAGFELHFTVELAYVLSDIGAIGVNILKLDLDSAAHLRRLIEVNLGSDESLQRELASLVKAMEQEHHADE